MLKKVLIGFGVLAFLFVATAVIVPFVVDVDQYRPQLVKVANENINGRLELGKLQLSLWGKILVRVDGVRLYDRADNKVLSVEDAFFHFPFLSLFSGAPLLTFKMNRPEIKVVKNKNGELNVLKIAKTQAPTASQASDSSTSAPKNESSSKGKGETAKKVELPAIALRARLGVELSEAFVSYVDQQKDLTNQVRDLNIVLKDISLSRPTEMNIWANLDTRLGKSMTVRGPFKVTAVLDPKLDSSGFQKASVDFHLDLDDLKVAIPGAFSKNDSVDANVRSQLEVSKKDLQIKQLKVIFHNAEVDIRGNVANLDGGGDPKNSPVLDLEVESNPVEIAPWVELVPALGGYELGGSFEMNAKAQGPTDRLSYQALLKLKDWSAQAPQLKAKPVINGEVRVKTDQVEKFLLTMKAPGNDLKIDGQLISFQRPNLRLAVTSNGMDINQLVKLPEKPKEEKKGSSTSEETSSSGSSKAGASTGRTARAGSEDLDAKVAELKKNEVFRQARALITAKIKTIRVYDIDIANLETKLTLNRLRAAVETFKLKLWSGGIQLSSSLDLNPPRPSYSIRTKIDRLDLKKAVTSQLALFKNTVYGMLNFNMNGRGSSLNAEVAKKRLNVKGKFRVNDAVFTSIDVGKMTTEALNKSVERIAKKFPQLKNKKVKGLPNRESRYERVSSDFSIANGVFNAPNFVAKSAAQKGVDLEGKTRVGLLDQRLNARWKVIDRYNLTKAKDLSVNIAGSEVKHILASGRPPAVSFPVTVTGTLENPRYSYSEVPEYLMKVAVKNTTGAAKSRAQAEVKKRAGKQLEKVKEKAPKQVKKLFKKFGF